MTNDPYAALIPLPGFINCQIAAARRKSIARAKVARDAYLPDEGKPH